MENLVAFIKSGDPDLIRKGHALIVSDLKARVSDDLGSIELTDQEAHFFRGQLAVLRVIESETAKAYGDKPEEG